MKRIEEFFNSLWFLALIVAGIVGYLGYVDYKDFQTEPTSYNTMMEADVEKGVVVDGTIQYCLGCYEEEYKTRYGIRTSGGEKYYYAIPVGEAGYMGLKVSKGTISVALDKLTNATYDYLDGVKADTVAEAMPFTGRICKMTSEDEKYMKEFLVLGGYSQAEANDYLVPYYIDYRDFSVYETEFKIALIALLVSLLLGSFQLIKWNKKRKRERAYYEATHPTYTYDNDINQR